MKSENAKPPESATANAPTISLPPRRPPLLKITAEQIERSREADAEQTRDRIAAEIKHRFAWPPLQR